MAFYGLWLEYALEGSSNFIAWRERMEFVLEDNGLKEFVGQEIPKPVASYAQNLVEWKKCVAKTRRRSGGTESYRLRKIRGKGKIPIPNRILIMEVEGVDYDETFAPIARYSSIRSILALSAHMGWKIQEMDVKTNFLNGMIEEEVYIE
eukprot:PITA_10751